MQAAGTTCHWAVCGDLVGWLRVGFARVLLQGPSLRANKGTLPLA